MQNKTPPKGEVSRGLPASFTPANLSLSAFRVQHLMARYALPAETAVIFAALLFDGGRHG